VRSPARMYQIECDRFGWIQMGCDQLWNFSDGSAIAYAIVLLGVQLVLYSQTRRGLIYSDLI